MRPVNLVPQDQRRRTPSESSGKGAHALLGLLAVLLAMTVAYVLTANTVTERKSETEQARVEADRLEAEAAKKGSFTDFADIARTRAASVAAVASSRFDWERLMRELSRVMPEGSWLVSADASLTGDTEGASDAAAAAAPAAPAGGTAGTAATGPTAALVGCTPKHSDVARMMVRLRQLHRVTDVQLGQSTQNDDADIASFDSCGRNTSFDVTLTFSPTTPVAEAPRGATRVPASLGGGS
jgi:Tfp pilus assembly protein PilN